MVNPALRQPVTPTTPAPYRQVAWLEIYRRSEQSIPKKSTAFLVDSIGLLTAGHSVAGYPWSRIVRLDITLAASSPIDSLNPFTKLTYRRNEGQFRTKVPFLHWIGCLRKIIFARGVAVDYGMIRLADKRLFKQAGSYLTLHAPTLSASDSLMIAGYPCDKPDKNMWAEKGKLVTKKSRYLTYSLFTRSRSSGSPLWVMREGKPVVVGIHNTGGVSGCDEVKNPSTSCAYGTRLTERRTKKVQHWFRKK